MGRGNVSRWAHGQVDMFRQPLCVHREGLSYEYEEISRMGTRNSPHEYEEIGGVGMRNLI